MHFCENPLDVLDFYPLIDGKGDFNEFTEIEALGKIERNDKKFCTDKLKIGVKIGLKGLIKASIDFVFEKTKLEEGSEKLLNDNSGNSAQLASSGYYAVVMCAGADSKAKAMKGSWITLSEWEYSAEVENYIPVCVKTVQVDGESIKEDIFYKLVNGEFMEVEE